MPGCAAFSCHNRREKGYSLFRFPTNLNRRKLWEIKVKRERWSAHKHS